VIQLKIERIGICFNPFKKELMERLNEIKNIIKSLGFEIIFTTALNKNCFKNKKNEIDLLVAFGGDGTVLKAFHSVDFNIPVLGINFGKLGFLTHYHPEDIMDVFTRIKEGNYKTLDLPVFIVYINNEEKFLGINDIVISKSDMKILEISLKIDSYELKKIPADGIVVSTQLGSTAYNLSNGGAIISPKCKAFEISFISPHVMTARPIVIGENEKIEISICQKDSSSYLAIDGIKSKILTFDEIVSIVYSEKSAKLLSVDGKNFYELLMEKIGWGRR